MAKTGFFFYHGDYYKDTRCLSLQARGGWVDLWGPMLETEGTLDWPIIGYARFWGVSEDEAMEVLLEIQHYRVGNILIYEQKSKFDENGKTMANLSKVMAKVTCRRIEAASQKSAHLGAVRSASGKCGAEKRWQNDGKNGNLLNLNPSLNLIVDSTKLDRVSVCDFAIDEVISQINALSGKNFSPKSKQLCQGLRARLKSGVSVSDCLLVVNFKWREWGSDDNMQKHFNPTTLFRPSNFERYMQEAGRPQAARSVMTRPDRLLKERRVAEARKV